MLLSTLSCRVNIRFLTSKADFIAAPLGCASLAVLCEQQEPPDVSWAAPVRSAGLRVCRALLPSALRHVWVRSAWKTGTWCCVFAASSALWGFQNPQSMETALQCSRCLSATALFSFPGHPVLLSVSGSSCAEQPWIGWVQGKKKKEWKEAE